MARPEKPIDPTSGPLQQFAFDLRRLRDAAGTPSYRAMAMRTGTSPTTLSEAASGNRRPSLNVLLSYVAVCGGDRSHWRQRWQELPESSTPASRGQDFNAARPGTIHSGSSVPNTPSRPVTQQATQPARLWSDPPVHLLIGLLTTTLTASLLAAGLQIATLLLGWR